MMFCWGLNSMFGTNNNPCTLDLALKLEFIKKMKITSKEELLIAIEEQNKLGYSIEFGNSRQSSIFPRVPILRIVHNESGEELYIKDIGLSPLYKKLYESPY